MADDLAFLDATAQAELVRSGQLSPVELVDAAINRIEKLNPEVNAVIHSRFDQGRCALPRVSEVADRRADHEATLRVFGCVRELF